MTNKSEYEKEDTKNVQFETAWAASVPWTATDVCLKTVSYN